MTKIDTLDLYRLCNQESLFTCGTTTQYDKVLRLAADGVTIQELAIMLYICSDNNFTLAAITKMVKPLFSTGGKR